MKIAVIDLFCGAGGTTTGVEQARVFGKKVAKVIACVNHDPVAIASHKENHKGVLHFTEDIRTLDISGIVELVNKYRQKGWIIALSGSLECTNFSNAKGGQPRDADSRTLAEHLHRYIDQIKPDYIFIENVVEFMSWGPLNEKGKPLSRDKGKDYMKWVKNICKGGYRYDYAILNSADFGAHTSRKRYFGAFATGELPISFPETTHAKKPVEAVNLFADVQKKWKPVKEVLDLQDEGKSIFERSKPLSEKTLARIHAGLIKYVAGGKDMFIAKYFSGRPAGKVIDVEGPAGTITCVDGQSIVKANFILKYNSTNQKGKHTPPSVEEPCPVIAVQNRLGLITSNFMLQANGGNPNSKVYSLESPSRTITTVCNQYIINPKFLVKYYGTAKTVGLDEVAPTITTKDRLAKVTIKPWLDKQFSGRENHQNIEQPAGSILTNDKHCLVSPKPFLMATHYNNVGSSLESPAPVITANRKHNYIVNPSWVGNVNGMEEPAPVIIARQDKSPLYLVAATEGNFNVPVYDTDSPLMIEIKNFMALYGIVDIKMRMLKVLELLKIQGFPDGYILKGNQQQQKKFIGNSVVPLVARRLIEQTVRALIEYKEEKNAA